MNPRIGFAGLSHLGVVSSIATAARGFDVVAYDPASSLIETLSRGELPVHEPDLPELLQKHSSRIKFTARSSDLASCNVIILSIDIATNADNESDSAALDRLLEEIVAVAARETTIVILSQVRPGYTRAQHQHLKATIDAKRLALFYQVETLIFGRAVERALHPERFMIGCADPAAPLPAAYQTLLHAFDCPLLPMRLESAELAKISINIFLTSSVTATNTLAELCEKIGADWAEIAPALRLDRRIGPHAYLTPGLGIAGGNLERDLVTVKCLADQHGTDARLIDAFRGNSAYRRDEVLRTLHAHLRATGTPVVAVWGLAYKQNTHSIKNSPSIAFIASLPGFRIQAYDPQVQLAERIPGVDFRQAATAADACDAADALVVMTPWEEFTRIDLADVKARLRGRLLIDPFGCIDTKAARTAGFDYFRLGSSTCERKGVA
jgi:UDPglucose 6-dehydrogenase